MRAHGQSDVPHPAGVAAYLVVVQAALVLGSLEALLNRPPTPGNTHELAGVGSCRRVGEVGGDLIGSADAVGAGVACWFPTRAGAGRAGASVELVPPSGTRVGASGVKHDWEEVALHTGPPPGPRDRCRRPRGVAHLGRRIRSTRKFGLRAAGGCRFSEKAAAAARWDADAVRDYAVKHLGADDAVLIVDEINFEGLGLGGRAAAVQRTDDAAAIAASPIHYQDLLADRRPSGAGRRRRPPPGNRGRSAQGGLLPGRRSPRRKPGKSPVHRRRTPRDRPADVRAARARTALWVRALAASGAPPME